MTEEPDTRQSAFTSDSLVVLLNGKVLKSDLPATTDDPGVGDLVFLLNFLAQAAPHNELLAKQEKERLDRVLPAIEVLVRDLFFIAHESYEVLRNPLQPEDSDYNSHALNGTPLKKPLTAALSERLKQQKLEFEAIATLLEAAENVQKLGLPKARHIRGLLYGKWQAHANDLRTAFHETLPGRKEAAAYRFITFVIPRITGESPTEEAVKTFLKRRRQISKRRPRRPPA